MCENISLPTLLLPAQSMLPTWALLLAGAFLSAHVLLNKRRFDVDADAINRFIDDIAFCGLIVCCWDAKKSLGEVQCVGGRGNAFGEGASKYLLPAKCKFGGEFVTPAGDAKLDGDRDGDDTPPEWWLLRWLLLWNIGMDALPLFDCGEWRPYRCLPDDDPFDEDDILRLLLFDDGELLLWLLLK